MMEPNSNSASLGPEAASFFLLSFCHYSQAWIKNHFTFFLPLVYQNEENMVLVTFLIMKSSLGGDLLELHTFIRRYCQQHFYKPKSTTAYPQICHSDEGENVTLS